MSKIRNLSGKEVIKIFEKFGFKKVSQKGSHVKLVRISKEHKEILVIPLHRELDKGTLRAIYKKSLQFIPEKEIRKYFYSE